MITETNEQNFLIGESLCDLISNYWIKLLAVDHIFYLVLDN